MAARMVDLDHPCQKPEFKPDTNQKQARQVNVSPYLRLTRHFVLGEVNPLDGAERSE